MKKLFESWNRYLLTEAAANVDDLIMFNKKSVTGPDTFNVPDEMVDWAEDMIQSYGPIKVGVMYNFHYTYKVKVKNTAGDTYAAERTIMPDKDAVQRIIGTPLFDDYKKALLKYLQSMPVPKSIIYIDHNYRGTFTVGYGAVFFVPRSRGRAIDVHVKKFESSKRPGRMGKGTPIVDFPAGSIKAVSASRAYGNSCSDGYISSYTYKTKEGWGPLLYSIAMEHATEIGGGLMSDRNLVSGDAKGVWDYFDKNKKGVGGPVSPNQMDITKGEAASYSVKQITPNNNKDDCGQIASLKYALGNEYGDWTRSEEKPIPAVIGMDDEQKNDLDQWAKQSLSKTFTKTPLNLQKLMKANLLHSDFYAKDLQKFYQDKINKQLANLKVGDDLRYRDIKESKIKIKIVSG